MGMPLNRQGGRVRAPPGGRARENRKFIQAPSPEIWSETISGGEEVLAGKWGGLYLGYLLRKKIIGSRAEAPPFLLALATRYDAQQRGRARSKRSGAGRSKIGHGASRFVQWPGCVGVLSMVLPRGMHWLGSSSAPFSTALTSRSNACCAWGWISSSRGNISLKVSM